MADDFLPRGDQPFSNWLQNFLGAAARGDRLQRWKLSTDELGQLRETFAALEEAMGQQRQLQQQAIAARVAKDALRRKCEKKVRRLARQMQYAFGITAADKADLGLRVPRPRLGSAAAQQPPATAPRLRVQNLPRRHLLHFVDEKTPSRKRKPPRVSMCEISRQCQRVAGASAPDADAGAGPRPRPRGTGQTDARGRGDAPAPAQAPAQAPARAPAQADWQFLAHCSATPQAVVYGPEEEGTVISYRCRWVNRRGQTGPWSNIVTALVSD